MNTTSHDNVVDILIVGDDVAMQRVIFTHLKTYFTKLNFNGQIEVCADAVQCIFNLNDHGNKYDIIFLDSHILNMDSIGIFHSIHMTHPELETHLIFLTSAIDELKSRMVKENINIKNISFLFKPFDYETLQFHVSSVLLTDHQAHTLNNNIGECDI
ncbi:MAG: response regulator [Ghiorsea sp.]|nr:response regulator [Ghiorsea sp.]